MDNRKLLADRIKAAAAQSGLSQRTISQKTGIALSTFSRWLAGEQEPNVSNLVLIAEAIGVSIAWLATGEGEMRPSEQAVAAERPASPGWPETDGRFLGRIAERISKVYQEVGAHIGLAQLTELAARHHDSIIALADDDEQREQLLVMALTKLRRELTSGNPSSKRRA
jgi:transcriptional regulator with XRE-family HTH domain